MSSISEDVFFGCRVSTSLIDVNDQVVSVAVTSTSSDERFTHPPQCYVKGITCPRTISERKWLQLNAAVKYHSGDILIVSYPKSGTTWLEQCVLLLLHRGDSSLLNPCHKNTYSPYAPGSAGKIWLEACIDQDSEVCILWILVDCRRGDCWWRNPAPGTYFEGDTEDVSDRIASIDDTIRNGVI